VSAPLIDPVEALRLLDLTPSALNRLLGSVRGLGRFVAGDDVPRTPRDLRGPYTKDEWLALDAETRAAQVALVLAARDGIRPRKVRRHR